MGHRICVVGLGYIGLPTSLIFAKHGFDVIGIDNNPDVVEELSNGNLHIEEEGLYDVFIEVRQQLSFRIQGTPCLADTFIIAVPTPIKFNQTADLSYVLSAVQSITPFLRQGNLIIVRIIGGYDTQSAHMAAELYRSFVNGEIIITSAATAEMAKLMENTYRDVNIALANELAKLSADIRH